MGPLQGVRVVELAGIGPAPFCAMLLADLGADVLRVDRVRASDAGIAIDRRHDFAGRNRRSIALDIAAPEGCELALRLAGEADVMLEGFRPGVAERLGVGPDACRARNPRLVYGRITGYGREGPLAAAAGHDLNYIALAGALHAIGPAGGKPVPPLNLVGDYGGGALYLAMGILAALVERSRSGRGQVVDAAMIDGVASMMGPFHGVVAGGGWSEERGVNLLDGGAPFYDVYETRDGRHVAITAIEARFFAALAEKIGLEGEWIERRNSRDQWPALRRRMTEIFRSRTLAQWCEMLEGGDTCFSPVLSMTEAAAHPQNRERAVFVEIDGGLQPAPAPRFDRTPAAVPAPTPEIGAHTDEILGEMGYGAAEIARLRQQRIVA